MAVERLTIIREVAPDFYKDGVEFLRMLREEQKCPVCQTGKVVSASGFSGGTNNRCNHPGCGMTYKYPEYPARPHIPDFPENVYRFGWEISLARARLAKKQAETAQKQGI
ncbi:hypothetical protein COT65_00585 [Candidatus Shapirobacteria bacterium CG09_land_8_20_14_0_10_47_13]|uniref:Uncharacterized protein n=1 Tax=Candidatus Shapirobacteria bacterium CG09_land_8_20_14_0_10_47_13 TaxID=1974481 RepID=A0A2H0WNB1_9BACT|nr:MAG: hypothetical protein COT65_00585 [Candidatus Shapirobacteria bacterium CG09_land_8_20_14_0_10_47_13]